MADQAGSQTELVYCHECRTDWSQAGHGLECPYCHSAFVEVIEDGDDPRQTHMEREDRPSESHDTSQHGFPNHHFSPWNRDSPDPDEGDIEHVEWNAGPGLRFSRTSYRTSIPGRGATMPRINDPFAPFFQSFSTIMEGPPGMHSDRTRSPSHPEYNHTSRNPSGHGSTPNTPSREETPTFGPGRHTITATTRIWPRDRNNDQSPIAQVNQLQGILGTLLQSLNTANGMNQNGNQAGPGGLPPNFPFHSIFAQILNPANAANGDAVYTEEALDRVISQFMDQANGSTAPGPASPEAIQGLPKKEVDKSMMGSDGKAECSVCMDSVEIGDEVTVLPCGHWFHGDCVGAWLKEHDTCPHCRQGIMPKETDGGGQANTPRGPGQPAQNSPPFSNRGGHHTTHGLHFAWQPGGSPTIRPIEIPRRPAESHRRRLSTREGRERREGREGRNGGEGSSGGGGEGGGGGGAGNGGSSGTNGGGNSGGSSGGISGWVRDRWGRSNSDRH